MLKGLVVVLALFFLPLACAISEYPLNSRAEFAIQLVNISSGSVPVTGASCFVSAYFPISNSSNWTYLPLSEVVDGSGTYNVTVPSMLYAGSNRLVFNCTDANGVRYSKAGIAYVESALLNDSLANISTIVRGVGANLSLVNASLYSFMNSNNASLYSYLASLNSSQNYVSMSGLVSVNDTVKAVGVNLSLINVSLSGAVVSVNQTVLLAASNASMYNASIYNLINSNNASMSFRFTNVSIDVWGLASRTLTGVDWSLYSSWQTYLGYVSSINDTAKAVGSNLSAVNASLYGYITSVNSSQNYVSLPSLVTVNDTIRGVGANLSLVNSSIYAWLSDDANVCQDNELPVGYALEATLVSSSVNNSLYNASIYNYLTLLNSTQNYATQQNISGITVSVDSGLVSFVHAPSTIYTTENLTFDVTVVNSSTGVAVQPSSINVTVYTDANVPVLSVTSMDRRSDGSYRSSSNESLPVGIYHAVLYTTTAGKSTVSASEPFRVAVEGNFDFSVDAPSVGVRGYQLDYAVNAKVLRGQDGYEATYSCQILGISGTSTSGSVFVTKQQASPIATPSVMLPKNLEIKHYTVECKLGYVDQGVPITITASDSFLAHDRGVDIWTFVNQQKKDASWARIPMVFLTLALVSALLIVKLRKKKEEGGGESVVVDSGEEGEDGE